MTRKQLIQEIVAGGFQQYEQEGLIDHQSLNRWIRIKLKSFGSDIMLGNEKTLEVINGKAKLPENFWKLEVALRVTLDKLKVEGEVEDFLQSVLFYKERTEVDVEWNNATNSFAHTDYKCIEEKYYLRRSTVTSCYVNPQFLRLTKGFNRQYATPKCHSLSKRYAPSSIYEVNIVGDYLNVNFDTGYVYIQYTGLQVDEDGDFLIPECNHNKIEEYLITYCRKRIIEDLIIGRDDPDLVNMLRYYTEKEIGEHKEAMTDARFFGGQGWRTAVRNSIKRNSLMYENLLPDR